MSVLSRSARLFIEKTKKEKKSILFLVKLYNVLNVFLTIKTIQEKTEENFKKKQIFIILCRKINF